ncbi:MAG: 4Fe-4S binding protein [Methanimicrococcus sp.]|nr:4Fe-4S binding protein [Methanimicrococcus sp.]
MARTVSGAGKTFRNIIKIDEELCNGCGNCISPCAEGAIKIINGKAKVVFEELCDGLGACLPSCPTGALTIEKRKADAFDDEKVKQQQVKQQQVKQQQVKQHQDVSENETAGVFCFSCGETDENSYLIAVRKGSKTEWICTKCLPRLIH